MMWCRMVFNKNHEILGTSVSSHLGANLPREDIHGCFKIERNSMQVVERCSMVNEFEARISGHSLETNFFMTQIHRVNYGGGSPPQV